MFSFGSAWNIWFVTRVGTKAKDLNEWMNEWRRERLCIKQSSFTYFNILNKQSARVLEGEREAMHRMCQCWQWSFQFVSLQRKQRGCVRLRYDATLTFSTVTSGGFASSCRRRRSVGVHVSEMWARSFPSSQLHLIWIPVMCQTFISFSLSSFLCRKVVKMFFLATILLFGKVIHDDNWGRWFVILTCFLIVSLLFGRTQALHQPRRWLSCSTAL